jgi:hypothetical protein
MANQAIALGIRAPQPIDLGAATARFGNMMANMSAMEKQKNDMARVNQLRSLIASGVDITTSEGFNQVASLDPQAAAALRKSAEETSAANRKREDDLLVKHRNLGVAVNSQGTWDRWLNGLKADDPNHAAQYAEFMGPTFDQAKMDLILSTADQYINKNIATARTDVQLDEQGNPGVVYSGGYDPARIVRPKTFGYSNAPAPAPAPAAAPQAQAAPMGAAPVADSNRSSRLSADLASPLLNVKNDGDYQTALMLIKRADPKAAAQLKQIMPVFNPAMMDDIRAAAQAEFNTVPQPQQIAGGRGGMGGPYEAVDQMPVRASSTQDGMVSNLGPEGLVETTPFRAKNPMQSPLPGSAAVPINRVRAEAAAARETPAEAAAKARAIKQAEMDVEQAKKTPAKNQVSQLVTKIRNAYEELNNAEAIPSENRGGFANAIDYMSTTSLGREAQRMMGTKYNRPLNEIVGSRKLLATAIKNATGMSAQEMNSNTELTLMLDALTDPTQGYESAISLLGTIEDLYGAPKSAQPAARKDAAPKGKWGKAAVVRD